MGSRPTKANKNPRQAAMSPLMTDPPVREARNATPRMANMKYWGEPTDKTSGLTSGMEIARHNAPKIAPTNELIRAAPRARPASPFLAMGWPSTSMEAVMASPGTPNRIDVMLPVVAVTAAIPRRKEKASTGDIGKMKGSIKARVTGPPMPGRIPTMKPMAIPANWRTNAFQVKSWIRPWRQASRISTIAEFQRRTRQPLRPGEDGPLVSRTRSSLRSKRTSEPRHEPPLHFFLAPGYQDTCQFGLECRTELIKAGHHLCYSGAINWIDVHLGFFRFRQEIRIAQRFHEGLLEKLETILRKTGRHGVRPRALGIG